MVSKNNRPWTNRRNAKGVTSASPIGKARKERENNRIRNQNRIKYNSNSVLITFVFLYYVHYKENVVAIQNSHFHINLEYQVGIIKH